MFGRRCSGQPTSTALRAVVAAIECALVVFINLHGPPVQTHDLFTVRLLNVA